MPTMKNRRGGVGKTAQVRKPNGGQPSNGVQKNDGTKNTNAGSKVSAVPQSLPLDPRIVRTYGS